VDGRLVPGVQKQDAGGDQLIGIKLFAFHFGSDQLGDQIVGGPRAAFFDVSAQEGHESLGRGDGAVFGRAGAACHVHADHGIGPAQKVRRHLFRHAQQPGDDADGQGLGEGLQKVEFAGREAVGQLRGKRGDVGGHPGDPARGEGAQHKVAQAGVAGRLQLQHRMGLDGVERGKVRRKGNRFNGFAAKAAVAEDRVHRRRVAGAGQVVVLPVKERTCRAGDFIERIGVLDKGGIGRRLSQGLHHGLRLDRGSMPCAIRTPSPTIAAARAWSQFQLPPAANRISMT